MTSRVWKYLGCDGTGRFSIAYRIDGEPLCVDCERDLGNEIANVLAVSRTPPPAIYETRKAYEGRTITWSICEFADVLALPAELLPLLQVRNCFPMHHGMQ